MEKIKCPSIDQSDLKKKYILLVSSKIFLLYLNNYVKGLRPL